MAVTVNTLPVDPKVISAWKACLKMADEIDLQDFAKNQNQMNAGCGR